MSRSSPDDLLWETDLFGFDLVDAPDVVNFSSNAERALLAASTAERPVASSVAVWDEEDARAVRIRD